MEANKSSSNQSRRSSSKDSEWIEIDENFLAVNLGEEAFIELLSQIEQSLLEDYHSEKENDDD